MSAALKAVEDSSGKPTVHDAWLAVMKTVQSVGKTGHNRDQNYSFRGVDATVNAVGPALREQGVFIRPKRIVDRTEERYTTRNGASMRNVTLTIEWEVTGPAGDSFTGESVGEAADSGDKAVSKAHSVAYRVYLLEALCIPTDEPDPDASSHERAPQNYDDPAPFYELISAAGNPAELEGLVPKIRATRLTQVDSLDLKTAYDQRMQELTGALL